MYQTQELREFARIGVDPNRFNHMLGQRYEPNKRVPPSERAKEKPLWTDRRRRKRNIPLGLLLLLYAFAFGSVIYASLDYWFSNGPGALLLTSFISAGLVLPMLTLRRVRWFSVVPAAVFGWTLLAEPDFQESVPVILLLSTVVTSFLWGIQVLFHKSRSKIKPFKSLNEKYEKDDYRFVYGTVAQVGDSASTFGEGNASAGAAGERSTAFLLETLLKGIPGTTIFHGLQFPGSRVADVDHCVVNGNTVIFIDSKQFAEGRYEWKNSESDVIVGGKRDYTNHMGNATDSFRRMLPHRAQISTIVMVHGKRATVGTRKTSLGVTLMKPEEAMGRIISQIDRAARTPQPENPMIKHILRQNLK